MTSVIQWNCRGLRANLDEVQLLINQIKPIALCLQETMQNDNSNINVGNYSHFSCNAKTSDGRACGGVSILVLKSVPHTEVKIKTNLQAVAARITLQRTITLCSIYLPPSSPINARDLDDLIDKFPAPILLMGDFNAHSTLWGCQALDARGKIIEDFIANNNLCYLNNKHKYT